MTQRVIKFRRAYFNYDGSFYGFKEWGPNIEGGKGFLAPSYIHGCKSGADQQFTGLLDKHGKEIYEGDILRLDGKYTYDVRYEDAKFVCYHIKGNALGKWGDLHRFFDPEYSKYHVVVIGDIYTTPELVDPKMIER